VQLSPRDRWALLAGSVVVFVWLRLEMNDPASAAVLGWGCAAALAYAFARHTPGLLAWGAPAFFALGALCGLAASACTAALMLLKNGSHGHLFPDYPFSLIMAMLERAPAWAIAGALLIGGLWLAGGWRRPQAG
jgi:hypothetical protein